MTTLRNTARFARLARRSFTLTELLIVIAIIAILSSTVLFALQGAMEDAREARTRSQIAKLHSLIMARWESYRTRAVRLNLPSGIDKTDRKLLAGLKLFATRDLQRMELPDRKTDVTSGPTLLYPNPQVQLTEPAIALSYGRRAVNTWSETHQGAECLYLIVASMRDGDRSALSHFKDDEIGDVDEDGMSEILDAWGNPIEFLRWAPGYSVGPGSDKQWGNGSNDILQRGLHDDVVISPLQDANPEESPDPFDPLQMDAEFRVLSNVNEERHTFAIVPLIYSAGRDEQYELITDTSTALDYTSTQPMVLDPFFVIKPSSPTGGMQKQIGLPEDTNNDGVDNSADNITNHLLASG